MLRYKQRRIWKQAFVLMRNTRRSAVKIARDSRMRELTDMYIKADSYTSARRILTIISQERAGGST